MQIELVDINQIVPYAQNPRINQSAIAKVADSIKEFGFRQPIVVDSNMVIIAGHTRYDAAKLIGLSQVPVHIADGLSSSQVRAYRLADNRLHEDAIWDEELLKIELSDLKQDDFGLQLVGFNNAELDKLLEDDNQDKKSSTPSKELKSTDFDEFTNICPKCGFEWDNSKL